MSNSSPVLDPQYLSSSKPTLAAMFLSDAREFACPGPQVPRNPLRRQCFSLMFISLPDLSPQISQHPLWQQRFSWMLVRLPGLVYKYLELSLAESFSLMCITLPALVPRYLETFSGGNASL